MIKAILAHDDEWGIGKNGSLPWPHNSADLRLFKKLTEGHAVVMGANTWNSLPIKPLPNRFNFIISSNTNLEKVETATGIYTGRSVARIVKDVIETRYTDLGDVWVIGGAQLFASCIDIIDEMVLNNIHGVYDCDTFLPKCEIEQKFAIKRVEKTSYSTVTEWKRK